MDFDKYNPLKQAKPPLKDWTESVPVVLLSEALKIVGQKHGISIHQSDDGRPVLCFQPGLPAGDRTSKRWDIAEQITGYFLAAVDDLIELINTNKLTLPQYAAGPSKKNEPIRVAKPR